MDDNTVGREHLLQKYGVLVEFDIVNITTLEEFMDIYEKVANSSDDIGELVEVSDMLAKRSDIPGFIVSEELKSRKSNPELDKIGYAIIEFIMKKTANPSDWAYILTYVIDKLGLEFGDEDEDTLDEE
tara:strand:+ start:36563 stop:36946 length:384 start_codon:yes stop_codon:yes gene_type:complete